MIEDILLQLRAGDEAGQVGTGKVSALRIVEGSLAEKIRNYYKLKFRLSSTVLARCACNILVSVIGATVTNRREVETEGLIGTGIALLRAISGWAIKRYGPARVTSDRVCSCKLDWANNRKCEICSVGY